MPAALKEAIDPGFSGINAFNRGKDATEAKTQQTQRQGKVAEAELNRSGIT